MTKAQVGLLENGPADAAAVFLFAHGAGAPMDAPFMAAIAEGLAAAGIRVVRFEFAYMAARRADGKKRPPPRAERMIDEFRDMVTVCRDRYPAAKLFVGGKSMGGRIASLMVAAEPSLARGLICLGYPFHPPGRPENLRTEHLAALALPVLICQGERDPFGNRAEVEGYRLSDSTEAVWLGDGDHGFKPRKSSGLSETGNWQAAVDAIARFIFGRTN